MVHEFVQNDGLACLIKVGSEADQNYQNYILRGTFLLKKRRDEKNEKIERNTKDFLFLSFSFFYFEIYHMFCCTTESNLFFSSSFYSYCLSFSLVTTALGQVMLYVDGMNGVINPNETIRWLYSLISAKVSRVRRKRRSEQ